MTLDPERSLVLAGGVLNVAVAALVLTLAPGRPLHRAFAALLAARGLTTLLPLASADPAWTWAAARVQPYFTLALVPLAVYAAHAARRSAGQPASPQASRRGWWTVAAIAALAAMYTLDPSLFHTLALGTAPIGALQAAPGIQYTAFGPLVLVAGLMPLALTYLGLQLAVLYRQRARTAEARPWLLLAGAFFIGALFDSASRLAALTALLDGSSGYPWLPWGWTVMVLPPLAILPAILGLAVLAADRAFLRPEHRVESFVLALCILACAAGFLRLALPTTSDPAGGAIGHLMLGLWRLAGPLLVATAFLLPAWRAARDPVREGAAWGLTAGLVAAAGVATALATGGAPGPAPLLLGVAAAVAAVACGRPLVRGGRWLASRLLPDRSGPDHVDRSMPTAPMPHPRHAMPLARGRRPFPPR